MLLPRRHMISGEACCVMTSLFLLMITGLMRFATTWFLLGKFGKLDAFIGQFIH